MYTVLRSDVFDKWLSKMKDAKGKARIVARIRSAELGNLGDVKSIGDGSVKCVSIMALDIEFTSQDGGDF